MATRGSREVDGTLAGWLLDPPSEETVLATLHEVARERGALVAVVAPPGDEQRFASAGRPPADALVRIGEATAGRRVQCKREDPLWEALLGDGEPGLDWLVAEPFGPALSCAVIVAGAGAPPTATHDLARLARAAALMLERAPAGPAAAEAAHRRGNLVAAVVYNLDYAAALLEEEANVAPGASPHDSDLHQAVQNAREAMARLTAAILPARAWPSPQALRGGFDDGATRHPAGEMP